MKRVLIVGGGPAGSMCGERLAAAGFTVTLFDEHLAWEKPCGGGLTHKAITAYPFLLDSPHPKKLIRDVEMISNSHGRVRFRLGHPIVIYSRAVLNGLLLDRAAAAGCHVVRARVTGSDISHNDGVRLRAAGSHYEADFVVLAAGARNALLADSSPLGPQDLELTAGYYLPLARDLLTVKFLPRFEGYLWSFPRHDHLSVGICGKLPQQGAVLRQHLDEFARAEQLDLAGGRFYSHVLPSPQASTLRNRRVAGRNWALVGDAAAWVDPLTGEGLYYAMRSGDLLAQALIAGQPESYAARVRAEFADDLAVAARMARRFYRGKFLGGAVTDRMIQFARRSRTFRGLLRDVFSGAQAYSSLKRRLWAQLGTTLGEILASAVRPSAAAPSTGESSL